MNLFQDDLDYSCVSDSSYKRSWDDLCMYKAFFTELYEFDVGHRLVLRIIHCVVLCCTSNLVVTSCRVNWFR